MAGRPRKANKPQGPQGFRVTLDLGTPNPKQAQFFESRTLYTAYGGARGGGKSWAVRTKAVGGAVRWDKIKILIVRRTYPELRENHIAPMLQMVPNTIAQYNDGTKTLTFWNGSIIKFGHAQSLTSLETEYQGQEYDWIFLDEATQFSEDEFRVLGGCLRGVSKVPKRFYLTCNPGGIGHTWVKRLFIDREFKTNCANPEENEDPNDYSFIFASVDDNEILLKHSPAYLKQLASLPEKLRAAHRYGDWDALSGAYFDEFSKAKHVVDQPFEIPAGWLKYRAFDYGLDMLACYWIAVSPEGRHYVYREFCRSDLNVQDAAQAIKDNTLDGERTEITFAPPDMWSRQRESGKSIAETFMLCGVPIVKASNNRVQGHLMVKEMLAMREDGEPGIMFFPCCRELLKSLPIIQADDNNPNDCAKEPHFLTHSVDALRYYCISRTLVNSFESRGSPGEKEDEDEESREDYAAFMCGGDVDSSYLC